MSVLVFAENAQGRLTRAALEAISYARALADKKGAEVIVFTAGKIEGDGGAGASGANKIMFDSDLPAGDGQAITRALSSIVGSSKAEVVILSHDHTGKLVAPRLAAKLKSGLVTGVTSLPLDGTDFVVNRNVFSGKAIATVKVNGAVKILSLLPNSYPVTTGGNSAGVEEVKLFDGKTALKVRAFHSSNTDGHIPLPEAEKVVSAGRGMKGPENWGMIEELARELGAATACSRPVADIGWRPHHEHVGQTGIAIRPNLYFAIGISGAIQHLAGVNGSKVIVVINKDPEAPFFKAADYGIVGDAFEVVPKLIEAVKAHKAKH
jgi:electron transfer flavoprotein alpha subunit